MLKRSVLVAVAAAGSVLLHPSAPVSALDDCVSGCAVLTVGEGTVPESGGPGSIEITFTQAPTVAPEGEGPDDIAAVAFSIGLPGDGSGNPLRFDCEGGQFKSTAVAVGPALNDLFAVVVENESCNSRSRCLCPDTGAGQTMDDFVNIVVYGPKELPDGGPVEIPRLPSDGTLVTLNLWGGPDAQEGNMVDLNVYCQQDNGSPAKPDFSAFLTMGDQSAIEQADDRDADRSRIQCNSGKVTIDPPIIGTSCVGDCNGDGQVAINELIRGVNINLGNADVSTCLAMDGNGDGFVAINELIQAVNNSLNGCPA